MQNLKGLRLYKLARLSEALESARSEALALAADTSFQQAEGAPLNRERWAAFRDFVSDIYSTIQAMDELEEEIRTGMVPLFSLEEMAGLVLDEIRDTDRVKYLAPAKAA